jgi:hypothetical protein
MRRRRGNGGFLSVEYAAAIGFLLMPVALIVMTLPVWPERQTIARVAAEEAARAAALESNAVDAATAGRQIAEEVFSNWGLDPAVNATQIVIAGDPRAREPVTATVTVSMPAVRVPGMFEVSDGWEWTAVHSEAVDKYRSFDATP